MPPKRKAPAAAQAAAEEPGPSSDAASRVVYIGHIPHGFYEKQLRDYFSQFGRVARVRLSRSKRTAASKGYAWLEFGSAEVAQVAADTMDGYLFFGQKLAARVVPAAEVHPDLFKGANRVFKKVPWHKIEAERHNAERSPAAEGVRAARALRRDAARAARIAAAGIEYEYEGLKAAVPPRAKKTRFD